MKRVEDAIAYSFQTDEAIEYISLTQSEYIQFLEEISPTARVLLTLPERCYKNVPIRVSY